MLSHLDSCHLNLIITRSFISIPGLLELCKSIYTKLIGQNQEYCQGYRGCPCQEASRCSIILGKLPPFSYTLNTTVLESCLG